MPGRKGSGQPASPSSASSVAAAPAFPPPPTPPPLVVVQASGQPPSSPPAPSPPIFPVVAAPVSPLSPPAFAVQAGAAGTPSASAPSADFPAYTVAVVAATEATKERAEAEKKKARPGSWACDQCTYANAKSALRCEICTYQPLSARLGSWVCGQCTFENNHARRACHVCSSARGGVDPAMFDSVVDRPILELPPSVIAAFERARIPFEFLNRLTDYIVCFEQLVFGTLLGRGQFGEVFRGGWCYNEVAIKVLSATIFTPAALEELRSEAAIMAAMRSDYIVQLRGYCEQPRYCLVMEYLPMGNLFTLLHSKQDVPWSDSLHIALDMACGLKQLHEIGIIHRDLKSPNVLLHRGSQGECRAKLADFGLSRVKLESSASSGGKSEGTPRYMAPELVTLKPKTCRESDMYAFGVVLWELAERKLPFRHALLDVLLLERREGGAKEEFSQRVRDAHPEYVKLAEDCWEKEREKRPTAAKAVCVLKGLLNAEVAKHGTEKGDTAQ